MKSTFDSYIGQDILPDLKVFVRERVAPNLQQWERDAAIPEAIWKDLHAMGLWDLAIPADLGGEAASTRTLITVMKELAYGSAALATAFTASMMSGLCIFTGANASLRKKYGRRIQRYGDLSSFAMTEKEGGSDISNVQTTAKAVSGGYILQGEKCFVTNAETARHFVILARLEHERRSSRGLTMFYLPHNSEGLLVNPAYKKFGQNAVKTHPISLREVFVPAENRIGDEGEARELSYRLLQRSRCFLAAGAIGLCERAEQLTRDYLSKRLSLRKSLLSQPVIRHLFAQLNTEKEAAWQLIVSAAQDWDDNAASLHRINMAKLYAAQVANRYVASMMELFGGWSYTDCYEIEQLQRDVKFYEAVEGPAFVQQILICRGLFAPPEGNAHEAA